MRCLWELHHLTCTFTAQVPSTAPAPAHQQYIEKNHHWHFLDTHSPPNAKTIGEQSPLKWLHQISCGSKISKMIRGTLSHLSFQHTSIPQNGTCDPVGPFDCSYSLSKPQFVTNRHSLESLDPDLFFRYLNLTLPNLSRLNLNVCFINIWAMRMSGKVQTVCKKWGAINAYSTN